MSGVRRVLVTGLTGFVGRPAVERLNSRGWEVHAIVRRVPTDPDPTVHWHQADLLFQPSMAEAVSSVNATHLLHLAWCAEPGRFWMDPRNLDWTAATIGLVAAFVAAGGHRIVGAGSCAEYDWSYGWCREDRTPLRPKTLYGAAKAATGSLVTAWGHETNISVAWTRLFHLYGPNEPEGKLVSSILGGLRARRSVPLTAGTQVRDFLHSHDAAAALVHLLDADIEGAVNIGSGLGVRVREVASTLAAVVNAEHLLQFGALPTSPDEPPLLLPDVRRLTATGWVPGVTLSAGLADLVRTSL